MSRRNQNQSQSRGKNGKKKRSLYTQEQDDSYEYKPRQRRRREQSQSEDVQEASSSEDKKKQESQEIKVPMKRHRRSSPAKNEQKAQKSVQISKVQEQKKTENPPKRKNRGSSLYMKLLKQIDLTKQDVENMNKQRERAQKELMSKIQRSQKEQLNKTQQKQQKRKRKEPTSKSKQSQDRDQDQDQESINQKYLVKEDDHLHKEEQSKSEKQYQSLAKKENASSIKLKFQELADSKVLSEKVTELQKMLKKQQREIQELKTFKKETEKGTYSENPNNRQKVTSIEDKKPISEKRIQRIERKIQSIQQLSFWSGCIRTYWSAIKKSSDDIGIGQGRTILRKGNKYPGIQFCLKKEPLLSNQRTGFSVKIKKFKRSSFLGLLVGVKFVDISQIQQNMRMQNIRLGNHPDDQELNLDKFVKLGNQEAQKGDEVQRFQQEQSQQTEVKKTDKKAKNEKKSGKISDRMTVNYVDDQNHDSVADSKNGNALKHENTQNPAKQQVIGDNPNLKGIIAYNVIGEIAYNGETLEASKGCKQEETINVVIDKGKYITWYESYNEIGSVKVPQNLMSENNVMMAFIGFYNKGDTVRLSSMIE